MRCVPGLARRCLPGSRRCCVVAGRRCGQHWYWYWYWYWHWHWSADDVVARTPCRTTRRTCERSSERRSHPREMIDTEPPNGQSQTHTQYYIIPTRLGYLTTYGSTFSKRMKHSWTEFKVCIAIVKIRDNGKVMEKEHGSMCNF